MAHRHEHLCSASQLWLPHPALCVVLPECFRGLCIWSGAMGSKSGKLRNIADHDSNPALVQLGTVPIPDLCITKSNPCGPHATHLPSLWACTTHIAIQGSGPARSPVAKAAPIFHCSKPCNRLANYSIPWPMGREILLSGQDSNLSSLGAYEGSALRGG